MIIIIIIIIITIAPIIIIPSSGPHVGQHPQRVGLGPETALIGSHVNRLVSAHAIMGQYISGQTIADRVQTQTARRIKTSFI